MNLLIKALFLTMFGKVKLDSLGRANWSSILLIKLPIVLGSALILKEICHGNLLENCNSLSISILVRMEEPCSLSCFESKF